MYWEDRPCGAGSDRGLVKASKVVPKPSGLTFAELRDAAVGSEIPWGWFRGWGQGCSDRSWTGPGPVWTTADLTRCFKVL